MADFDEMAAAAKERGVKARKCKQIVNCNDKAFLSVCKITKSELMVDGNLVFTSVRG